jgi:hypothetical protein
MSADIPVVVTAAGAQPTPPAALLAALLASVAATVPGYTSSLPGSLIEDVSSTQVGGLAEIDSARVETINSLTPFGANDFTLLELGQIYIGPGSAPAVPTNTSVYVEFTGTVGFVIPVGFTVSDGTYQYVVQDGGVVASGGTSAPLFCQATIAGSWAVPAGTVTNLVTSVPSGIVLTCSNPAAGISGGPAETSEQYRARVLQAGQAVAQGMPTFLKTLLGTVPGVQQRLISVIQQTAAGGGWEVICGGGDPYEVALAIFQALFDVSTLVGSTLAITNVTQAADAVITTNLNHNYSSGQVAVATGIQGMIPLNGESFTVTVLTEKSFSIGINTSGYPAYSGGGVLTPNLRNVSVNLLDYPNTYSVIFVDPPQQAVTIAVLWNTAQPNFVSQAAVAQLAAPAIAAYIDSIVAGQPINVGVMNSTFQTAVASVLDPSQISVLTFTVSINGIVTPPQAGTLLVFGDIESSFYTDPLGSGITVTQG